MRLKVSTTRIQKKAGMITYLDPSCNLPGVKIISGNDGYEKEGEPFECVIECDKESLAALIATKTTILETL